MIEKHAAPIRMRATDDQLQPPSARARHVRCGRRVLGVGCHHDEGTEPGGAAGDQAPYDPAVVDSPVKARYGGNSHERRTGQHSNHMATDYPAGLGGNAVGYHEDYEPRRCYRHYDGAGNDRSLNRQQRKQGYRHEPGLQQVAALSATNVLVKQPHRPGDDDATVRRHTRTAQIPRSVACRGTGRGVVDRTPVSP